MKNVKLISFIIENLSSDLLKPQYRERNRENSLWGHCYVASEVFYHLSGGENSAYSPYRMKVEVFGLATSHWFLKDEETQEIIDITAGQYDFEVDYTKAKRCSFLTKKPSKRAETVINRMAEKELIELNKSVK